MIRKIIQIEEEKCNGCGACADACHEGAIGMVNGKAKLLRDDYCDGLGDCLPAVLLEPLPCRAGRLPRMMRLRSFKIKRENKHITQAAPAPNAPV